MAGYDVVFRGDVAVGKGAPACVAGLVSGSVVRCFGLREKGHIGVGAAFALVETGASFVLREDELLCPVTG